MHNLHIGGVYRQKCQQRGPRPILRMSVNRVPTIFCFPSGVIFYLIGWRHPVIRYCQPLQTKTTVTCFMLYPKNEHQWSLNSVRSGIFSYQGITQIVSAITELFTVMIGNLAQLKGKMLISNLSILQAAKHAETYHWLLKTRF
jgi:hypothetical protein